MWKWDWEEMERKNRPGKHWWWSYGEGILSPRWRIAQWDNDSQLEAIMYHCIFSLYDLLSCRENRPLIEEMALFLPQDQDFPGAWRQYLAAAHDLPRSRDRSRNKKQIEAIKNHSFEVIMSASQRGNQKKAWEIEEGRWVILTDNCLVFPVDSEVSHWYQPLVCNSNSNFSQCC